MSWLAVGKYGLVAACCALTAYSVVAWHVSGSAGGSSAAPPTVVCKQTISDSAAGAVVTDATRPGTVTVTDWTVGGVILRVSKGCRAGATVRILPASAMRVGAEAHAKDGGLAAIVLAPRNRTADIQISRPDGTATTVRIRLTSTQPI
jgi:hypothetical protein